MKGKSILVWMLVLARVMDRLRGEYEAAGQGKRFAVLKISCDRFLPVVRIHCSRHQDSICPIRFSADTLRNQMES